MRQPSLPVIPPRDKKLIRLADEIHSCRRCALYKTRCRGVPGKGSSTWHPAAVLRRAQWRMQLWDDLLTAAKLAYGNTK